MEVLKRIDFSQGTIDLVKKIGRENLKDSVVELEELKTSMYLALWATQCTLSFEDFIEKLR